MGVTTFPILESCTKTSPDPYPQTLHHWDPLSLLQRSLKRLLNASSNVSGRVGLISCHEHLLRAGPVTSLSSRQWLGQLLKRMVQKVRTQVRLRGLCPSGPAWKRKNHRFGVRWSQIQTPAPKATSCRPSSKRLHASGPRFLGGQAERPPPGDSGSSKGQR